MTTPAYTAPIAKATIGLPDGESKALRRWLQGNRIGCAGAAIQPADVARRLAAWLRQRRVEDEAMLQRRRAEETAAVTWMVNHRDEIGEVR